MTEPDFVTATRTFYDTIAEDYSERFRDGHAGHPLERALLGAYAESVGRGGQVADLGCGPGRVTAYLAGLGLDVFGMDLSEGMLAVARREHPELRFEQGSMLDSGLADGQLAGVVCWYSSIHTPPERLPDLFGEFHRVLAPGGHLLLGFQVGDRTRFHDRPFGHDVTLGFQRRRPELIEELLGEAGFTMLSRTVREPDEDRQEYVQHAFLLARRTPPGASL
ncbi:class I SAM-dependent methyltransferase [Streptomyces sp. NPDC001002]